MPVRTYQTNSEEETMAIGAQIAKLLPASSVVLLSGNLGAGKTTLVKGIAQALEKATRDEVTSPTFTLIHEYGSRGYGPQLFHIDLYRLETDREVATLGLSELFDQDAIVLIEWGERFAHLMPPDHWSLQIEGRDDHRTIRLESPA